MLKFALIFLLSSSTLFFLKPTPEADGLIGDRGFQPGDTLTLPFDTAEVLSAYDLRLKEFSSAMPDDLDTFVLVDRMYACDCPSWAKEATADPETENIFDPKVAAKADVFYLERGDKKLHFPDDFSGNGNKIRFFGKIAPELRLPKEEMMDPDPPVGRVLIFYGYEVLLPAVIRGPEVFVHDTTNGKPEWAQYEPSYLIVTEKNYSEKKKK